MNSDLLALQQQTPKRSRGLEGSSRPLGLSLLLAVCLAIAGFAVYHDQAELIAKQAESELSAIAALKAEQIAAWVRERVDTGRAVVERPLLSATLLDWMASPHADTRAVLESEFRLLQQADHYTNIAVLSPSGEVLLSMRDPVHVGAGELDALARAIRSGAPAFCDVHLDPHEGATCMGVVAPFFRRSGDQRSIAGALLLVSDAREHLFPLATSWPTPSPTAESYLVTRDGDDAVIINDLRHRPGSGMKERVPVSETRRAAAHAAMGKTGSFPGVDYRGVPVLAHVVRIQDTPWSLVAKVDAGEAYATLRQRATQTMIGVAGAALLLAVTGFALSERARKTRYRALFEEQRARQTSEQRLGTTLRSIGDGVIATDAGGRVELMNPVAEALTGWSQSDSIGKPLDAVFPILDERTREPLASPVTKVLAEGAVVELPNHTLLLARDGRELPIADSGAPIRDAHGNITGVVLVFRDQSEERIALQKIEFASRLVNGTQEPIYCLDPARDFQLVFANDAFCRHLGYDREKVLTLRPVDWDPNLSHDRLKTFWDSRTTASAVFESTHRRADGSLAPVEVFASIFRHDGRELALGSVRDISKRLEVQAALQERERAYASLLSNLAGMVYRCQNDPEWTCIFASDGCRALTGYEAKDLIGNTKISLGALIHPDDAAPVWAKCQANLDARLRCSSEYRIRCADGSIRWVWDQAHGIYSDTGELLFIEGYLSDITERIAAEQELGRSQERYRLLFDSNPSPMWVYDVETLAFLDVNEAAIRHYGYSRQEFLAMTIADIRPAEDVPALPEEVKSVTTGIDHAGIWRHRKKDGTLIHVEITSHTLDYAGRRAEVVLARDVTAQIESTRALHDSEERLRLALTAANQGLYDLDVQTGNAVVSPEYATMLGFDPATFRETNAKWIERLHPDDREAVSATYRDYLAGKLSQYRVEFRQRTASGKWQWILSIGKIMEYDAAGKPLRMTGTHTDINERKRAEAERERLQGQLAQAQKMESIGRLAGGVSHDFNNMLAVILGRIEIALEAPDLPELLQSDLLEIRHAAQRSAELTKQLLAFSRRQVVTPQVLDLGPVIRKSIQMLSRLIGENIGLTWKAAPETWPVRIDPVQLDQILANLCLNARDAIQGVGEIAIAAFNRTLDEAFCADHLGAMPGEYAAIEVRDTGCGIPADVLAHLFEPFFTTKELGQGTGLGLATVYGIVKQNKGYIAVSSQVGSGTTFTVYLPRVQTQPETIPEQTLERDVPLGQGQTVLLVEDEVAILRLCKSQLEKSGYAVLVASTPDEALQTCRSHKGPIHIMVTDVIMPGMNGRDLSRHAAVLRPGIRFLFMSGYSAEHISNGGTIHEGLMLLQKPFTGRDLLARVHDALTKEPPHLA